jgi:hypothetical protein
MSAPPAYLDECIDRPVTEALRRRGFDILTAIESGLGEEPDEIQLAHATRARRVLISYNRWDFRRLHAAYQLDGRDHGGIVIIPQSLLAHRRHLRAALLLDWLGTLDTYHSRLFQWNDLQQLLLRGLRLPGYSEEEVNDAIGRSHDG